jgi:hypothetical protein
MAYYSYYKKVECSLRPGHPTFIGPSSKRQIRRRAECKKYYDNNKKVKASLWPGHPLFIGPKRPMEVRARSKTNIWCKSNKPRKAKADLEYRINNQEAISRTKRKRYERNKKAILCACKKYAANRAKTDHEFAMKLRLRSRVSAAVRRGRATKSAKTMDLIGCTTKDLCAHIQSQFVDGMTWENAGRYGWHIDHIIPCAAFDLTDPKQQRMCFHYTNLRPLWGSENMNKGDKITKDAIALIGSPETDCGIWDGSLILVDGKSPFELAG